MTGKQITLKSMEHHTITTKIRKEKNMKAEEIKRFESMSEEEMKEDLLCSLSDCVRDIAEKVGSLKRSFVLRFGTEEDFDKSLNREMERAYRKFKDMSEEELHIYMVLSMAMNGNWDGIDIMFKDGEDEDA